MEKTFKEMIEEVEYNLDNGNFVVSNTVKELLQQVREATKVEIMERVIELNGQMYRELITEVFDEFPTDRIRIEPLQKLTDK